MKLTKTQLKKIIKEELGALRSNSFAAAAEHLRNGNSSAAKTTVLDHYWMDDTWRMEEDALENILVNLGQNPTPEDVRAAAEEWLVGYRAGKYRPKTREEEQADWDRR